MEQLIAGITITITMILMIGVVDYLVFYTENCSNDNTFYGFESPN